MTALVADRAAELIAHTRFTHIDEAGLQAGIAAVLAPHFVEPVQREVQIGPGSRIDLLVGELGIEVKVAGSVALVVRQLRRYAATGRVTQLILVSTRVAHRELNGVTLSAVPVTVVIPAWL